MKTSFGLWAVRMILASLLFFACTTKDNSFRKAPGADLNAQNSGVQSTGSPLPEATPVVAATPETQATTTREDASGSTPVPTSTP